MAVPYTSRVDSRLATSLDADLSTLFRVALTRLIATRPPTPSPAKHRPTTNLASVREPRPQQAPSERRGYFLSLDLLRSGSWFDSDEKLSEIYALVGQVHDLLSGVHKLIYPNN